MKKFYSPNKLTHLALSLCVSFVLLISIFPAHFAGAQPTRQAPLRAVERKMPLRAVELNDLLDNRNFSPLELVDLLVELIS